MKNEHGLVLKKNAKIGQMVFIHLKEEATEPRLKEFFGALVEIETDHLDLHSKDTS